MGMDVYGKAHEADRPEVGSDGYSDAFWERDAAWRSRPGAYFRASVWTWHPLWETCAAFAPELCAQVVNAHTNDGDGLDAEGSRALAAVLRERRAEIETHILAQAAAAELAPDEACDLCAGTGRRAPVPARGPGDWGCNACGGEASLEGKSGRGRVRPFRTNYSTSIEEVDEFATFLEACGGFEIW